MDNQNQNNQQPNNGYQQPNNGYGYQQPNGGYQQPNNGYGYQQQPNGGYSYQQPNNGYGYQQYNNGYQQPNNGYGYQQPNGGYPGGGPGTGLEVRSIVLCIILSLVTCGIYSLYWIYVLAEDMKRASRDPNAPSGGMVLLLSIVTCGIYQLFWMYRQGETIDRIKQSIGVFSNNTGIIYLVLSLFGLSIVSMALMQDELNKFPR